MYLRLSGTGEDLIIYVLYPKQISHSWKKISKTRTKNERGLDYSIYIVFDKGLDLN